jgi:mono/diheme cytochrome c family protein
MMQPLPNQNGITAPAPSDKARRGEYLVKSVMACTDCHTPIDSATGAPQMDKYLGGGQPYEGPWGIVYGGNITPDSETGLGSWTESEIKRAVVAGIGKDGRRLILMPWFAYAGLTPEDADAVAFYLKNGLAPVNNQVPAASLNPDFVVMAPQSAGLPVTTIAIVVVAALVIAGGLFALLRRKNA